MRAELGMISRLSGIVGGHLWAGVDLFFVISGFLVTQTLLREKNVRNASRRFYLRRSFRLVPLYLCLLASSAILQFALGQSVSGLKVFEGAYPEIAYLTFLQNFWLANTGSYGSEFLAVTWSLAIEIQFYAILPIIVLRFNKNQILIACAFFISLAIVSRSILHYPASYSITVCRADSLFLGVAICALLSGGGSLFLEVGSTRAKWTVLGISSVVVYAMTAFFLPQPGGAANHFLLSVAYSGFLLMAIFNADGTRMLSVAPLVWLGKNAYGVYLFHYGILVLAFGLVRSDWPRISNTSDLALTVACFLICITVCEILRRTVEMPWIIRARLISEKYWPRRVAAA